MSEKFKSLWELREIQDLLIRKEIEAWFNNEFLTFYWWILVVFLIFPWVIWFKFADRTKFLETFLFGALVIIPTTLLDAIGNDLRFWSYPTQLMPITPRAIPFDMAMVPVAYMLMYQYFNTWKTFVVALVCMAGIYAFIGEPISHYLELVIYFKWKYMYSFIYYILLGIIIRTIVLKFKNLYLA
ncbi:CBO0543 family protein [Bacillus pinisoli]|uniref:CBO0543 family protein n=1 Tax=Bacillus pinisoli TaxID=2901866 RepID=UPI001FF0DFE7|nr:CBO0543 family protein [Bacillus pinisoli]